MGDACLCFFESSNGTALVELLEVTATSETMTVAGGSDAGAGAGEFLTQGDFINFLCLCYDKDAAKISDWTVRDYLTYMETTRKIRKYKHSRHLQHQ